MKTLMSMAAAAMSLIGTTTAEPVFAGDLSVGTTGVGGDLQVGLNEHFVLRGSYNYLEWELDDEEYDDISYDGDLDFSTFGAFLDLHPFGNSFTVTGGVYVGEKSLGLDATPTGNVEIGDMTFTPAEVGILTGSVDLEETAPYLGIGFDNLTTGNGRFGAALRVGVMMTGDPEVELSASGGTLSDDPTFLAALEQEEQNLADDADDFEFYPVASLAAGMRF